MATLQRSVLAGVNKLLLGLLAFLLVAGAEGQVRPELKRGMIIHWGLLPFTDAIYHGGKTKELGRIPQARFAPQGQDARQWARVAKEGGMTYAILVAKHEDGFCLWPSADSEYTIAQSPCKLEVLGNFIDACKAEGLHPGVLYSLIDVYNEGAFRGDGPVGPPFFNLAKKQMTDLVARYPDLRILMVDCLNKLSPAQVESLLAAIKESNPQCLVMGDPKEKWGENFICDTVPKDWFWHTNTPLTPAAHLLEQYYQAQRRRWPFILSVGPDPSGRIPDDQAAVVMKVRDLIAANPNPPPPPPVTPAAKPDATARLKQVKSLFDQGLINQEDYDKKVKEIMNSL